ncbi:hypothetical protein BS47DRAFT_1338316 [Hydnum rufescens UP504]|uniref:Uncharacterized protein n=1 Tax=Hydnum rufescens UP504 TaxID=1448309 RepID=A0A9P6B611_9AGAM|nr:hypothetical protein BS47DRAFT_1338316 [Hydnum rufescens UP504]
MVDPDRPLDIHFSSGEIITIDLANLDPEPGTSVVELLREGECHVKAWVKLAVEYWKLGLLQPATDVAAAAVEHFQQKEDDASLPRVYSLLANLQLERARSAPKMIMSDSRSDVLTSLSPKSHYYQQAAQHMNQTEMAARELSKDDWRTQAVIYLTRGNYLLSMRQVDDALSAFDQVLNLQPTNIPALLGKARIFYTRRQHRDALKVFQRALTLKPNATPDPRIGIGLCLWALGNRDKARAAWARSLEVNPNEWASQLLLGLEALNASRESSRSDQERAELYRSGLTRVQTVFKMNKFNASSANALSDFFLRKGDSNTALKLAERTIQYADTLAVLADGHLRAARVGHASGKFDDARRHYASAVEGSPKHLLANIGMAQMQIQDDEILAAIHNLDSLISQSQTDISCLEALIILASLHSYARPVLSAADAVTEKLRAKELYDRVLKVLDSPSFVTESSKQHQSSRSLKSVMHLGDDVDMYVEIAALWQRDNLERTGKALKDAVRVNNAKAKSASASPSNISTPKLLNNLAAVRHIEGSFAEARALYEEALPSALAEGTVDSEASSVTILYNLARVYEDLAENNMARDAYLKLLARHPEYVDAKARLAVMRMEEKRYDEAHSLIKQALASGDKNPEIRAFYIYLLCHTGQMKPAKAFTFNVLKDDGHDVYALCAAGRLSYQEARESRDPSPAATTARKENFLKAANIFVKALNIDPSCAIAAQGLAIIIAEDSLGSWAPGQAADDSQFKMRNAQNARQALDILAKVRESLSDGSVYVNMGHCHFVREEYDKAIENYETASRRFYHGQNVSVLTYLSRTWFAKATKAGSFSAMKQALKFCQTSLHIQPNDKAVLYNLAMIEQKAGELIFSLAPDKRTLADLQMGIDHAVHAQKLFASLASDIAKPLPYSQDIAQQRYKYGDTMLRRSVEHVASQKAYEAEVKTRLDAARKLRQEEKEKQDAAQKALLILDQKHAEEVAERRRILRAEAESWASRAKEESEEEEEKRADKARKAAARKAKQEANPSGDEAAEGKKEKKRRRIKIKKEKHTGEEAEAVFSQDEAMDETPDGADRPKKIRTKKRIVDDDEDALAPSAKRKKIKSKEIISSDEDM